MLQFSDRSFAEMCLKFKATNTKQKKTSTPKPASYKAIS